MSYKDEFYKKRKADLIASYDALIKEKKTRDQALEIMSPIFSLTPESIKVIMSYSNYNKKRPSKKNT